MSKSDVRNGKLGARATLPWGVNTIGAMIAPQGIQSQHAELGWVRAVPVPYRKNFVETVRAAWWVLTGKAEAVIWPASGELEAALEHNAARSTLSKIRGGA